MAAQGTGQNRQIHQTIPRSGGCGHSLDANAQADTAKPNHRQQAIPEHARGSVCIDSRVRHQIEKRVHGGRSEKGDAVDVGELRLAGLQLRSNGQELSARLVLAG